MSALATVDRPVGSTSTEPKCEGATPPPGSLASCVATDGSPAPGPSWVHSPYRAAVAALPRRIRGRHLFALDLAGIVAAAYLALALRDDRLLDLSQFGSFLPVVVLLLAVRAAGNVRLGLYRRRWRSASVPDVERILVAAGLGTLVCVVVWYGSAALLGAEWVPGVPRSFWLVEALLSVAVLGGVRFGIRAASDLAPRTAGVTPVRGRATLLYGAGRTGALVARSAKRAPGAGIVPVGFLDDDHALAGDLVAGVPVLGGLESLKRAVIATGAKTVLITMPSAPGRAVRRVVDSALALGLDVRTVPSMMDLLDGTVNAYRVRRVRVEDLLRRPPVTAHEFGVEEIIRDHTVLITGAGGSIGSELARQVFAIGPRRLVLVDRAESPLYLVQRELETRRQRRRGSGELCVRLANVVSRGPMEQLIASQNPSVIFHAAAYKHVPLLEEQPSDAIQVNVGGTLSLLDAAAGMGVERFVFVSTDKAVRPSCAMGASKRIAEMLVADTARRTGLPYVSVRFGNVLGSTGSVVPIFQNQLENGEPLTITHPDMTRFFMTIPEAAWLILDAAAVGRTGDLFVLDMGEPVRIMDLARDLIRLAGRDPETQPIEIVGLRPGEKLHEDLFYDAEEVERTPSSKVLRVIAQPPPLGVHEDVQRMLALATGENEDLLRRALLEYVYGLEPLRGSPEPDELPEPDTLEAPVAGVALRANRRSRAASIAMK